MHRIIVVILLCCLGCGDGLAAYEGAPGNLQPGSEGRAVHLVRRSTRCGSVTSPPLSATVGPGAEIEAERTEGMRSPCPGSPSPAVDIDIEAHSVLFDFSSVDAPGVFPNARFEGYRIHFARACPDMALASASVDAEHSSLRLGAHDVETHYDHLDVNLAGVAYDETSFIKIDLETVFVNCLREL
jgi:hypothetical protein